MSHSGKTKKQFVRLTKSQRIQHIILVISTTLLIITGFMLQADRWFISIFGSASETIFWLRGIIHRIAGVSVTIVCVYHLIYVTVTKDGRSWVIDMVPKPKDVVDAVQNMMYMVGFKKERPRMDRFIYIEKLEYWSVYFGMFIVIITGSMMWSEYLWPKFYMDVAGAFHLGEATLAALAIIIGHIFSVHYNPHVYPMNRAFLDGMIDEDLMKEEHQLWYEREMKKIEDSQAGVDRNG